MQIGLFGGTFDPPHISHTLACLYALETTDIEKILVIPCFQHPLGKNATPFNHRTAMCRLAMECLSPGVEVTEIEAERPGPSFTIDTLRILRERLPGDEISLLIGSDILEETRLWKSFDEIRRTTRMIVLPRPQFGDKAGDGEEKFRFFLPDISSTEIRACIKEGKDPSAFLSRKVLEYIRTKSLYGIFC